MPFLRYATAKVIHPHVSSGQWGHVRTAGTVARSTKADLDSNLVVRASDIFDKKFNPEKYLLTHATIIASVDTMAPPGAKTGSVMEDGFRVDRKFADYRIKASCDKFINNNMDAWSRPVILKAYQTFVGAHNFVEHVQIEEMSRGRIIDAVARDIGDSVYVDILIATDRENEDLIAAIENGKMGTLSMGCFLPGTQVSLADGRRIAIEDVQPGDMVLTHKGRSREVLNKQIRGGTWGIKRIEAVGIPTAIPATDNHPFYVFRQPDVCACGCGKTLSMYKGGRRNSTRGLSRRFLRGHDKNIFNPNNTYSLDEARTRKGRMEEIRKAKGVWVRADELRVGDFLCFPRVREDSSTGVTEGRARLLGYFLAEGTFLKSKGIPVETQFCFSLEEKGTYAAEVVGLLKQEFPTGNEPWIQDREDRNTCTVHISGKDVAAWFKFHGGEYGNGKRLSSEAMGWPVENHKHLIGTWINGDGSLHGIHEHTSGVTTSYDLACQMHLLMARCGWFARMECKVGARSIELREVVNGGFIRDEASGRLPAFNLVVGKVLAQGMSGYTTKVSCGSAFESQGFRVRDDVTMFPITAIESDTYEGFVHNMEVAEDNSYIVEGVASHNCTVDGTICTKCGHWAADETELCPHVKYSKGNVFFDEQGNRHRVAELCGHESIDPHGGVQFIEASWVGSPAFTGAVLRNILEPSEAVAKKAEKILSEPPAEWSRDKERKAANFGSPGLVVRRLGVPRLGRTVLTAGDDFLSGWEDRRAQDEAAPAPEEKPVDKLVKDVHELVMDKVRKQVEQELKGDVIDNALSPENATDAPNDTLIKEAGARFYGAGLRSLVRMASSDVALVDGLAAYHQRIGIEIPVRVYRAALAVGHQGKYESVEAFRTACAKALGRQPTSPEARTILRISKLLSQRLALGGPDGSRQGGSG